MEFSRTLEVESAMQSVYFATRHLDQAATRCETLVLPQAVADSLALARTHASRSLGLLVDCLPAVSAGAPSDGVDVPF